MPSIQALAGDMEIKRMPSQCVLASIGWFVELNPSDVNQQSPEISLLDQAFLMLIVRAFAGFFLVMISTSSILNPAAKSMGMKSCIKVS